MQKLTQFKKVIPFQLLLRRMVMTVDETALKTVFKMPISISIGQNLTINETTEETTEPSSYNRSNNAISTINRVYTKWRYSSNQYFQRQLPKKKLHNESSSHTPKMGNIMDVTNWSINYILNAERLVPENQEKVAANYVASRYGSWLQLLLEC